LYNPTFNSQIILGNFKLLCITLSLALA